MKQAARGTTLDYVSECDEEEGFLYTFVCFDRFLGVEDPVFHKYREEFIEAVSNLETYLGITAA